MVGNGLNNFDSHVWDTFVASQWSLHNQFAWTMVKHKDLKFLRQLLQGFVIHGRDHAINEIFIFCPFMYWKVVKATFGDQQVYRSITFSPIQTQQYLLQQSKQGWLRFYSWGRSSSSSCSLPIAYVLLKQKKDFQVARPIISYKFFIFAKLFRATAIVLDIISRATMPSSFGLQTFPAMMHQIVSFFQHLADDCQLECYNQDLVGFFTSIPVHRIMEAVDWMLRQFMVKHDIDPATYFFSVSLREKDSKLRVWKARLELQAAVCIKYSSGTFWPLLELLAIPAILQSWDVYLPNKEEQPLGTKFHLFLQTSVWLIWNKLGTLSMNPFLDKLLISFSVYDTWTIELFLLTTRLSTILLFKLFFMMTFKFHLYN